MTISLTNLELIKLFATQKINLQVQKETDQLFTVLHFHGKDYPFFLRIFEQTKLLQMMVFLPCRITSKSVADLSRLLHRINREIDMPGFGLDEDANVVFYRLMLSSEKKKMDEKLILSYFSSFSRLLDTFSTIICGVADGRATFSAIMHELKALKCNL